MRQRMSGYGMDLSRGNGKGRVQVKVCVGTSCMVRGSQKVLRDLLEHVGKAHLEDKVDIEATFCFEACDRGPTVTIGGRTINRCSPEQAVLALESAIAEDGPASEATNLEAPGCGGACQSCGLD